MKAKKISENIDKASRSNSIEISPQSLQASGGCQMWYQERELWKSPQNCFGPKLKRFFASLVFDWNIPMESVP